MEIVKKHKHLIIGIALCLMVFGVIFQYHRHNKIYPSTDDAYVQAYLINMALKVSGSIQHVYVKNNQFVHQGDLLLDIDPVDYNLALTKAKADLVLAKQQAIMAKRQVGTAQANIARANSDNQFAHIMAVRYTNLYNQKSGSKQDMEKYVNDATQAQEVVKQAVAALAQAKAQYDASITQIAIAKLGIENAQNDVNYTQLRAPVDGYVSDLNLQTGELVGQGQKLFGLVDNKTWWVDANFKETQLDRMKSGQPVNITLDMYDHAYKGILQSIGFASGNTFSLLPPENASGNWVKVTQRFVVKIKMDDDPNFPLRVGASCNISVDTKTVS